jgi:hypothetical protein
MILRQLIPFSLKFLNQQVAQKFTAHVSELIMPMLDHRGRAKKC